MFRMIGAMVVYGFALYGLVESADWLTDLMDQKAKTKSPSGVSDQVRDELHRPGNGKPDSA